MRTNRLATPRVRVTTHEGAPASHISLEQELRRTLMSCLLWEDTFYESGEDIASRIAGLIPQVEPVKVAALAYEARTTFKLRHVPLLVIREMARLPKHKAYVADLLEQTIQRADELAEFLAIYWKEKRQPLSAQVKRGLGNAFRHFNEYALAKYDRDNPIKLKDVLFLTHPKPLNDEQATLWKRLVDGQLASPETWENRLSRGENKQETWIDMLQKNELGALALLRNLRNMHQVGVPYPLIADALNKMNVERVLPYRFISAARYAPTLEPELEQAMFRCIEGIEKLPGHTVLLIDVSGSMDAALTQKSEMTRIDAANGLAVLAREMCERATIYAFSNTCKQIPTRRGFALRDAINNSMPHGSTYLGEAVDQINKSEQYDRLVVFTDEQSHDRVSNPKGKGYMVNVASYQHGVGYGAWTHIDGFSEATLRYIQEVEK